MNSVIHAENLSKKYIISHQRQEQYQTLRDSLMHMTRGMWQRIRHPLLPNCEVLDIEEFWALRDINLEIKQGDRVGIIGRNGAGKSTLLKIISRITDPTTGRVWIKGRVASLLEVGTGFHRELTGRENIYLNGAIMGMNRQEIKKKFDEIVAFSEVEKFLDTPVKRYSSGMYVRLAFSVAAHLEPEVLLVDEVLAVGDLAFQKKCLGKMGDVAEEGRTVLFVSHNMAAVNKLCKKCILLEKGRIETMCDTENAISHYLSRGESSSGLVRLEKTQNKVAVIEEVGIINSQDKFSANVEVNRDFHVWIKCTIKKKMEMAQIAVAVLSMDGSTVFVTTNTDATKSEKYCLVPKVYRVRVRMPANFLNVGAYSINVRIFGQADGEKRTSQDSEFQVINFRVEETGSIASKLSDKRKGFVTPVLNWVLE